MGSQRVRHDRVTNTFATLGGWGSEYLSGKWRGPGRKGDPVHRTPSNPEQIGAGGWAVSIHLHDVPHPICRCDTPAMTDGLFASIGFAALTPSVLELQR